MNAPVPIDQNRDRDLAKATGATVTMPNFDPSTDDDERAPISEPLIEHVVKLVTATLPSRASNHTITMRRKRRPSIGAPLAERFADGEWHELAAMATVLETDVDHVNRTLQGMVWTGSYGCKAERKRAGKTIMWRIYKVDAAVPVAELRQKLEPIVKKLEIEGRKSLARLSPTAVAALAHEIHKLLIEWAERKSDA